MRAGRILSREERGEGEDADRVRLTFRHGDRAWSALIQPDGRIVEIPPSLDTESTDPESDAALAAGVRAFLEALPPDSPSVAYAQLAERSTSRHRTAWAKWLARWRLLWARTRPPADRSSPLWSSDVRAAACRHGVSTIAPPPSGAGLSLVRPRRPSTTGNSPRRGRGSPVGRQTPRSAGRGADGSGGGSVAGVLDRISFVDRPDSPTHVPQARRTKAGGDAGRRAVAAGR